MASAVQDSNNTVSSRSANSEPVMQDVAGALVRLDALAGPVRHLSHGSRLFRVPAGWQGDVLAGQPDVAVCTTMLELDSAFVDETKKVILLPHHAMMTVEDIERISHRHGAVRTLFWEERMP